MKIELSLWNEDELERIIVSKVGGKIEVSIKPMQGDQGKRTKHCFTLSADSAKLLQEFLRDFQ